MPLPTLRLPRSLFPARLPPSRREVRNSPVAITHALQRLFSTSPVAALKLKSHSGAKKRFRLGGQGQ
ncbi:MAG: hypothetical protein TREMPRED_004986 [Tremellales sp. Tagirdzhanova-0007]|nr:MAG: hypothetical protein TREMPRED_004986 [Tremellales sp. Tagirdzhanova-0007]